MEQNKKPKDNKKKNEKLEFQWKKAGKTSFIWITIILVTVYFSSVISENRNNEVEIEYTEYKNYLNEGAIKSAIIINKTFYGEFKSNQTIDTPLGTRDDIIKFRLSMPFIDREIIETWDAAGIVYTFQEKSIDWTGYFLNMLPWVILIGFWFFMLRRMQGGAGGMGNIFKFGKSKASLWTSDQPRVTFKDVAGCDEAKEELKEVIEYLKSPKRFQKLGAKVPKGALLVGQPGTGKTLMARAVAGEAGVPFYSLSGADFVEMFVGVGASRVRDLFEQAKKSTPCIIFIDELDAVGRQRGAGIGGGHDEREQTLNALLVEMDGFDNNYNIIVIAATNRPDVLDSALLRPGRFDRQIIVDVPDIKGRLGILQVHTKKVVLNKRKIDLKAIAKGTPGMVGADLANIVNEAALLAARAKKRSIDMDDFEEAKDKVMMGSERRSMVMTEEEKTLTAYHEAGHAIVTINEDAAHPIHKATIIPRGRALGMVMQLPEKDQISQTREQLHAQLAIAMGGRVAEEIIFGEDKVTTGASSDIEQATQRARAMVMQAGLSKELGPVAYGSNEEEVFLGRSVARTQNMSEETSKKVDSEIRKIVDKGYERARTVLTEKIDDLHKLAKALLTYETLSGEEIENLINKNIYPSNKEDLKVEDEDKGSALSSMGLKPKIVH